MLRSNKTYKEFHLENGIKVQKCKQATANYYAYRLANSEIIIAHHVLILIDMFKIKHILQFLHLIIIYKLNVCVQTITSTNIHFMTHDMPNYFPGRKSYRSNTE